MMIPTHPIAKNAPNSIQTDVLLRSGDLPEAAASLAAPLGVVQYLICFRIETLVADTGPTDPQDADAAGDPEHLILPTNFKERLNELAPLALQRLAVGHTVQQNGELVSADPPDARGV